MRLLVTEEEKKHILSKHSKPQPKSVKEIEKEIKHLEKSLEKYKKQLEKMQNKGKKSEEPKSEETKEMVDEMAEDIKGNMEENYMEEEKPLNESFLYMQKLAGVITEAQYNQKKRLIKEGLISGALAKIKDKILNSSLFNKLIDTIVSKMSDKDIAAFKSKFNLNEAEGGPSLEDIMSKVDAANPDKDVKKPEELKEVLDEDTFVGKIVNLVRNVAGINLLALAGAPLGVFIPYVLGFGATAIYAGPFISLIGSMIIHGICRRLLGRSENEPLVGD